MGKLYNALNIFNVINIYEGRILMNKNNLEQSKQNNQSGAIVNSSTSGASLQSSSTETATNNANLKVLSNEQAIAAKGFPHANLSNVTSNTNYATPEEIEKFNEVTAAVRDVNEK